MKNNKFLWLISALCGKILTLALLFLYNSQAEASTTLNVWLTSGGVENYTFEESLTLTASSATELTLTSADIEVVYSVENIRKLTIDNAEAERIAASISTTSVNDASDKAQVYNMSGVLVTTLAKDAKNATKVDLQGLPAGIYIIKSNNTQFKVRVK